MNNYRGFSQICKRKLTKPATINSKEVPDWTRHNEVIPADSFESEVCACCFKQFFVLSLAKSDW